MLHAATGQHHRPGGRVPRHGGADFLEFGKGLGKLQQHEVRAAQKGFAQGQLLKAGGNAEGSRVVPEGPLPRNEILVHTDPGGHPGRYIREQGERDRPVAVADDNYVARRRQ